MAELPEAAPGVKLFDTPGFPAIHLDEARAGGAFLDRLRREEALDWTSLSPSAMLVPGERTGRFSLGTDGLLVDGPLVDGTGASTISFEDHAVALADEIGRPAHRRRRFTVGYR